MTAEKKRVTILVDSAVSRDDQNIFNFGSAQPHTPAGCGNGDDEPVATSYQRGRKSIVEGVDATDLLQMHRKSLADLGTNSSHAGEVDPDRFAGVTLSRRHRVSRREYDEGKDDSSAQQLEGFSFGTSE